MHGEAKYGQGATARNIVADNNGLIPGRWQGFTLFMIIRLNTSFLVPILHYAIKHILFVLCTEDLE